MARSTLVIAHRACPRDAPENSLEGVRAAAALGADLVEVDVRRCLDGVPVLMHDALLRRTTGRWLPVRMASSRRLRTIRLSNGEPVPTLADLLDSLPDRLGVALDIKDGGAAGCVLAAVRRRQLTARQVLLWSQRGRVVWALVRAAPELEVALLRDTHSEAQEARLLRDACRWGARAISVHQDAVRPELVETARRRGLRTYTWFQDLVTQCRANRTGLAGVVTDWVAEARSTVVRDERPDGVARPSPAGPPARGWRQG